LNREASQKDEVEFESEKGDQRIVCGKVPQLYNARAAFEDPHPAIAAAMKNLLPGGYLG
jgi:hypothetical protein